MDFEKLYRERFRDVYLYLRSLGARPPLAEEIAQETFSKAMKAIGRFDGREDIRAWLFVIARNSLYSHKSIKSCTTRPLPLYLSLIWLCRLCSECTSPLPAFCT